ncbi:flagellar hook-basal body complex protein FliE [Paracraurococcus lichenis]|uniref:Flagellar hook-basal body complex protein FliE n=1 Tax=Paracraurococcus lichenis TaxID=3064888 RepID=A0ABT9DZK8_9PROT|nr:flagellar hook-basal body complex protein FliE [Paracraurococcus sp. LOR1-02]MDO9709344.1 flagellar hook-basal body complex protein FliE [Paracraurococcus sp. LOR1-02]
MPPALGPLAAAAAYRAAQSPGAGLAAPGAEGGDFGAALQRAVEGAVEIGRAADAASGEALVGQGSVTDVVLAVARAEMALQTAVTLRDKVVAAYQDVMRMPI